MRLLVRLAREGMGALRGESEARPYHPSLRSPGLRPTILGSQQKDS
jgi:hypothetical protein